MRAKIRPDVLLLISLVLVILVYPVLDHGDFRRSILGAVMFIPVILSTVRLAEAKRWWWPAILLMTGVIVFTLASTFSQNRTIDEIKWGLLTVFFALTVVRLFSYLRNARSVDESHLVTAVSIYLLLGMLWFALYNAIEVFSPDAILHKSVTAADRQTELMYFSLVTLSTIGYGDVVPVGGEARMLAGLEGVTGVLYVAITVAILVSAYKSPSRSN
jgi:hypothetical protein